MTPYVHNTVYNVCVCCATPSPHLRCSSAPTQHATSVLMCWVADLCIQNSTTHAFIDLGRKEFLHTVSTRLIFLYVCGGHPNMQACNCPTGAFVVSTFTQVLFIICHGHPGVHSRLYRPSPPALWPIQAPPGRNHR
jgi:hypothetical protein